MRTLLLISNTMLHYRVSVYNYLCRRFREHGWQFSVITDQLQQGNQYPIQFDLREAPFSFSQYSTMIKKSKPDAVILFLHLKDRILWSLIHWLKLKHIPVIFWTKGANLDEPDSRLRYHLFNYIHGLSDELILYSAQQLDCIKPRYRRKAIPANNTLNFADFPKIQETKEQIKAELGIHFPKLVLFAGTMGVNGERKKVEHLIEIFRQIERDDIGLIIAGSAMPERLRHRLNPNNTSYLGEIHDPNEIQISRLFKAADIFVVPGHVGLGLNQAFYWGLPVVTEEGNQPPEIHYLKSGRNGFIVPADDLLALKEKILFLLDNDAIRSEFSQCARADILREASVENMFQAFHKAVTLACARHRQPAH